MEERVKPCGKCNHLPAGNVYCPCSCHDRFRGKQMKK